MEEYNYNFEISKNLKMLEHVLDSMEIRRYEDMTGKQTDRIKVNFIYGPKSRILQDITGKPDTVKFPIVAMTTTGMRRDDSRNKNKTEDIIYKNEQGGFTNIRAIPWNIDVEITILGKYQQDVEQIIQNFSVFFNPYIVYSIREPKTGNELRVETHWDGNIGMDYPTVGGNLDNKVPYRLTATAKFTIKTWLFRTVLNPVKPICFIYDDIIVTDMLDCDYKTTANYASANQTDYYSISGQPQLRFVNEYYFRTTDTPTINVDGGGFQQVTNLYLSGNNSLMYPMSAFTMPDGTVINGYPIDTFSLISPQRLSFQMPTAGGPGLVDIIAVNDCGWSKLTKDANRCNRVENPYPVSVPEHYSWCVEQYPYLNGLIITSDLNAPTVIYEDAQIIYYEPEEVDRNAIIEQIRELMQLGEITVEDLT